MMDDSKKRKTPDPPSLLGGANILAYSPEKLEVDEAFLKLGINELTRIQQYITCRIKQIKHEKERASAHRAAVMRLKREYLSRVPVESQDFNETLVQSRPLFDYGGYGGYEGSYDDKKGISLTVKAYATWRGGDHDMFTDVWGSIDGKSFSERGS